MDVATATDTRQIDYSTPSGLQSLAISPNGSMFAALAGRFVKVWRLDRLTDTTTILQVAGGAPSVPIGPRRDGSTLTIEGHENSVLGVAFSADGSRLFTVAADFTIRSWDPMTGSQQFSSPIALANILPNLSTIDGGKRLLYGPNIYDGATGQKVGALPPKGGNEEFGSVMARDASVAAAATPDGVAIWDVPDERAVSIKCARPACLAISPDGKTVFAYVQTAAGEPAIVMFDTTSGQQTGAIPASGVSSMTVSPDGKRLVVCNRLGMRLVDIATGQDAGTSRIVALYPAVFSPDGKMILVTAAGRSKTPLVLLELPTFKELVHLSHGDYWSKAAFSPDGTLLAVSDMDRIRVTKVADLIAGK
jgi:WD40 repeat protein